MQKMYGLFIVLTFVSAILLMSIANVYAEGPTYTAKVGQMKKITFTISNTQDVQQPYVYIIQIKDEDDFVDQLSWVQGVFQLDQEFRIYQSWIPEKPGDYEVEIFVWGSINNTGPLVPTLSMKVIVEE